MWYVQVLTLNRVQHVLFVSSLSFVYHTGCRGVFQADRHAGRETERQTGEDKHTWQTQTCCAGLTGSKRVVHRAGDPSLPGEQGPAQAHVVSGASDAELGQQQLPARPLHLCLSVLLRPSAGWGGSGSPGTVTYARPCSFWVSDEAPNPENKRLLAAVALVTCVRVADSCSGCFSDR